MNLAIVGGGTAGWLTALYAKKCYPQHNVFLIESDEIGILGAGEGSTPHLVGLFDFLEIPFSDLVKNCNATVKNGIKFTNWDKTGNFFFHPFASSHEASNDYNFYLNSYMEKDTSFSHIVSSQFNHGFNDYVLGQKVSNGDHVPFIKIGENEVDNPLYNFNSVAGWSLHFNANILAKYLRKVGEERGILRIEGIVNEIKTDDNEYINFLLVNDKLIPVDFVFDCTGFKRLIIGNFYKSEWKSHSIHLPAKRAVPFFLPIEEKLPPYTEAIAMNYGWMWKIPVQDRYGCGYVFDSDFISDDDAKKEIDDYLGFEVESPRTFSFNPGCYKKIWIKNCLAIGLSSGFIEPLEATSLWQLETSLKMFFSFYKNVNNDDENVREILNNYYLKQTDEIVDFLYLHYTTNKDNTDFWKFFTKNNLMPDFIKNVLEIVKEKPLDETDLSDKIPFFNYASYFYVLVGNKIVTEKELKKYFSLMKVDHTQEYLNILSAQERLTPLLVDHKDFILKLRG